jgi:hypothetical protein
MFCGLPTSVATPPCPLEEAVEREERPHAHDREQEHDRRVIDGLGGLVRRDRAHDGACRSVETGEPDLAGRDQHVGHGEHEEALEHRRTLQAFRTGRTGRTGTTNYHRSPPQAA